MKPDVQAAEELGGSDMGRGGGYQLSGDEIRVVIPARWRSLVYLAPEQETDLLMWAIGGTER